MPQGTRTGNRGIAPVDEKTLHQPLFSTHCERGAPAAGTAPEPGTVSPPKIREVTGWLMCRPDALDTHDQQRLACLRTQCPRLDRPSRPRDQLRQDDHSSEPGAQELEVWLAPVEADDQPELHFSLPPGSAATRTPSPPGSPSLQQQVTQGLSVVKIGILLAPWHRRPGPGRGAPRTRPSASRHRHDHSLPRHGAVRLAIPGRHRRSDLSWKVSLATKLNDDDRRGDPGRRVRGANQCACRQARAATRTPRPIELPSRSPRITPPGVIPG